MPKYSRQVRIPGKTAEELYQQISQDIDHFLSKTPIGKYQLERRPEVKEVEFKSSMASAILICGEEELRLNVNLSLLATPFRSKLDEGIDKWLARKFNLTKPS